VTADLIGRVKAGDEHAFRQLIGSYQGELQLHCYRILGSAQDAEDALQETLLAAWRGLAHFEGRSSVRTWLYRVATSCCLKALRSASRRPPVNWPPPGCHLGPPTATRAGRRRAAGRRCRDPPGHSPAAPEQVPAAPVNCLHCGTPIPAGSRRDQVYCNNNCDALASYCRRKSGAAPPPRWQHPALGSVSPALRAAAAHSRHLGETHGWSPSTIRCAMDGLTVLLDGRPADERVTLTEIRARTPRHASAPGR
jgi:DNA-directed RNA polymerase specialized sigma24 family protein